MRSIVRNIRIVSYLLIVIALGSFVLRMTSNEYDSLKTGFEYSVSYDFLLEGDSTFWVTTYLPETNNRQEIFHAEEGNTIGNEFFENENALIRWSGLLNDSLDISYTFRYRGKHIKYAIDETAPVQVLSDSVLMAYVRPGEFIQSDSSEITELADRLIDRNANLYEQLMAFYTFVYEMPTRPINQLTDALTALEHYEASCNGKSRLFVALCRNRGIPSRVAGGIILDHGRKKTSHLWAEVFIKDRWVPFDALNGYFAEIPSNYLELYKGDNFLISRSADMDFDYMYHIEKYRLNTFQKYALFDLWGIVDHSDIHLDFILILLLLPVGAFIVALFKNVVGLKTYGIFLPVLIAFAFIETGWLPGLILFTSIVLIIGLLNYPLDKWGVLHTPKMVFMLTTVVFVCLLSIRVLFNTSWADPSIALFFPIIILTITAERFARKIEEEDFREAILIYAQTILVTLVCMLILSSELIRNLVVSFPEILLAVAGLSLLLGKWIGLRLTEYSRFYDLTSRRIDEI